MSEREGDRARAHAEEMNGVLQKTASAVQWYMCVYVRWITADDEPYYFMFGFFSLFACMAYKFTVAVVVVAVMIVAIAAVK